ncbi:MAG: toll/interleukin-1 receptor domain-containing protein [Parvibaculum sp.]|uniref:toll/interleukin-1 receptor domain-containing protein n=1 Tax=Parvibaculum sp. TaxID=2024848 RepID=UPI00326557DC
MSYASIYEDLKKAHKAHKAKQQPQGKKSPFQELTGLLSEFDTSSPGERYLNLCSELERYFEEHGRPLNGGGIAKTDDKAEAQKQKRRSQREHLLDIIKEVNAGNQPKGAQAIIQWAYIHHEDRLREVLKKWGIDLNARDKLPVKYRGFISWSGPYGRAVAECIKDFFESLPTRIDIFLSSRDIELGESWREALERSMAQSASGILIVTQDFADSAYGAFEYGALSMRLKRPKVLFLDAPVTIAPPPIKQDHQYADFSFERLMEWIGPILDEAAIEVSSDSIQRLERDLNAVISTFRKRYVSGDDNRWKEAYGRPFMMAAQSDSPYDLEQRFLVAKNKLILVAQNHYFMTMSEAGGHEKFWPLIADAMKRGVKLTIVAMHPEATPRNPPPDLSDACGAWGHYMGVGKTFTDHCLDSWKVFKNWEGLVRDLKSSGTDVQGRYEVYAAYFEPLSYSLVDPDDPERGFVVVSPRPAYEGSRARPEFVIRRQWEFRAFEFFHGTYGNSRDQGGWKLMLSA